MLNKAISGTIASTMQQAGRAGRRAGTSLALMVCRSTAMDQYVAAHPEYVLDRPQESAVIDPDNLIIFVNHLKCAAFELPFDEGELFGGNKVTGDVLEYLVREARILHKAGGRYHWMAEAYPAEDVSLSSADVDYFVVIDEDRNVVMAQVDRADEILGLRLNADWVVLSACNTAAADGAGAEAVSGLGRAFFYAGAKAILVSNWPVHSDATRALMTELFAGYAAAGNRGRAEALQGAMAHLIDEGGYAADGRLLFSYAHPIFWAPFMIVGDGG